MASNTGYTADCKCPATTWPFTMEGLQRVVAVVVCVLTAVCILDAAPSCPKPADIQTEYVKKNFNVTKFLGVW